jgi:hypothetical protein
VHREWSYFHECVARNIITCRGNMTSFVNEYGRTHLSSAWYNAEVVDKTQLLIFDNIWTIVSNILLSNETTVSSENNAFSNFRSLSLTPLIASRINYISEERFQPEDISLTDDQARIFDRLRDRTKDIHLVTISLRCGKSFFISYMKRHWATQGKNVLLTTTTSIAMIRLDPNAMTVHSTFNIPVKGEFKLLHRTLSYFEKLYYANIIVIDKCNMPTKEFF